MEEYSDLHNYLLPTSESFRKLRYVPETVEKEVEAHEEEGISGGDAFVTSAPLQSGRDFGDARLRGSQGHLEDGCSGGGENLLVAEPGSLAVTGPAGVVVGAKGRAVAGPVPEQECWGG